MLIGKSMSLNKITIYIETNTKIEYEITLFTKLHYT